MELGSNEAVKCAAAAGLGLGMVSKFGAAPDIAGGFVRILPVKRWDCRRHSAFSTVKGSTCQPPRGLSWSSYAWNIRYPPAPKLFFVA